MDAPLGLLVGVGLAAACGFRIFVPLLVMSIAAASGHLTLTEGWQWLGSPAAITAFGAATALEIAAYYIPAVDNALDLVAGPAAVVAGTIVTAACVGDISPFLKWSIAAIAGGGAAAAVQGLTTVARLTSTTMTAGLGNHVVSTGEAGGSVVLAGLAIVAPIAAAVVVALIVVFTLRAVWRWLARRKQSRLQAAAPEPLGQPMA